MEDAQKDRQAVYEIGYLIAASIPEENVPAEADKIKKIITDAGASVILDEVPHKHQLAYTMRRKTVAGSYEKYDEAYFGWIKFEVGTDKADSIKKSVEVLPSVLRMIILSTVRENTYLGKRAPAIVSKITAAIEEGSQPAAEAAPSVEEMDKSIDEMVKEV